MPHISISLIFLVSELILDQISGGAWPGCALRQTCSTVKVKKGSQKYDTIDHCDWAPQQCFDASADFEDVADWKDRGTYRLQKFIKCSPAEVLGILRHICIRYPNLPRGSVSTLDLCKEADEKKNTECYLRQCQELCNHNSSCKAWNVDLV